METTTTVISGELDAQHITRRRNHAIQRLWEHYHLRLNAQEYDLLCEKLRQNQGVRARPDKNWYWVQYKGHWIVAAFDHDYIATFIRPTSGPRRISLALGEDD